MLELVLDVGGGSHAGHRRRHRDHRGRQPHQASARGPHAGQARGSVRRARASSGFGLSNDERRGAIADFVPAFRIAGRAGLRSVPHGGELAGPASVQACLDELHADRIGHGVSAVEDPILLRRLAASQTRWRSARRPTWRSGSRPPPATCRCCRCWTAGVPVALGADDPLLFGPRLAAQYELARQVHGLTDAELADLARMSVQGSAAPAIVQKDLLAGIDAWLAAAGMTTVHAAGGTRKSGLGLARPHATCRPRLSSGDRQGSSAEA